MNINQLGNLQNKKTCSIGEKYSQLGHARQEIQLQLQRKSPFEGQSTFRER